MWFPETIRTLVTMGAEVIYIHAGTIDRNRTINSKAMASINQCFMFDVNGLDTGGCGRSIICGPDGRVLYQSEGTEEIIPLN
jgi:predicted amidohydrolase